MLFDGCMPQDLLKSVYPELVWHGWKFIKQRFHWHRGNIASYLSFLSLEFGVQIMKDWKRVGIELLPLNERGPFSSQIEEILPFLNVWPSWQYLSFSKKNYHSPSIFSVRDFLLVLNYKLNFGVPLDCRMLLRAQDIRKFGGGCILKHYDKDDVLKCSFPEIQFYSPPSKRLNTQELSDFVLSHLSNWKKYSPSSEFIVPVSVVKDIRFKLGYSHNEYQSVLKLLFPEFHWWAWNFSPISLSFWKDIKNQREFIHTLSHELGILENEDWYNISPQNIIDSGGQGLLYLYGNSISSILLNVFPNHSWTRFINEKQRTRDLLSPLIKKAKLNQYESFKMVQIGDTAKICSADDWFRIPKNLIPDLLSVSSLSTTTFINSPTQKRSSQFALKSTCSSLLPTTSNMVFIEDHHHPSLNGTYEIDLYIESLALGFEYNGKQHYEQQSLFALNREYKKLDEEKRTACSQLGISVISVPFWWDNGNASLRKLIISHRPDVSFTS